MLNPSSTITFIKFNQDYHKRNSLRHTVVEIVEKLFQEKRDARALVFQLRTITIMVVDNVPILELILDDLDFCRQRGHTATFVVADIGHDSIHVQRMVVIRLDDDETTVAEEEVVISPWRHE